MVISCIYEIILNVTDCKQVTPFHVKLNLTNMYVM